MVDLLEAKDITQLTETLLVFDLSRFTDEIGGQPMNFSPVVMTSGNSPYAPTIRLTVKRKENDPIAFALWRKTIPPYPAAAARAGFSDAYGNLYTVSGGILYINGEPWWWQRGASVMWPTSYTPSKTTPPTNWDPLGVFSAGTPDYTYAYAPVLGEVAFYLYPHETWWPVGEYFGWIEFWTSGNGTPPATEPQLVLPFKLRINRRARNLGEAN